MAAITGVKAHVLRYWESEFPTLKPRKTRNGSRRYRQPDIDEILAIKTLLYDEGYKIAGARKMRRQQEEGAQAPAAGRPAPWTFSAAASSEAERLASCSRTSWPKSILKLVKEGLTQAGQEAPRAEEDSAKA